MIKVEIKSKATQKITHAGTFQDQAQVDAWIVDCEAVEAWGKPAHQVTTPAVYDEEGQVITEPVTVDVEAEYEIIQSDNSAQEALLAGIQKNKKRIEFGMDLFAELAYRNKVRLVNGETTVTEVFTAEAKLATVQRLLINSSTEKAYQDLLALDIPEFPTAEKTYFLNKIQSYLAAE